MLKVEYAGKLVLTGKQIAGLFDVAVDLIGLQTQIDERKKSLATILDALELNSSSKSFSIHR